MKRMMMLLLVAALCACGCKTSKNTADASPKDNISTASSEKPLCSLTETKWMLSHIKGQPVKDSPEYPYVVFVGDRMTGSLGCNTFFGTFYANKKGKIDIEYTGSTKRLCNDMEVEYQFISALKTEKTTYSIVGRELIIRGETMTDTGDKKNVEVLRFKAEE